MPLLPPAAPRPVLLVVNDLARTGFSRIPILFEGADVVECPSADAAWSALVAGRRYSAVVTGETDAHLDAAAIRLGVPVVHLDGAAIGDLERAIAALRLVPRASWAPATWGHQPPDRGARLVTVCGPGGTGTSTVAACLAATISVANVPAGHPAGERPMSVILADFALHADQAYLHGMGEPATGLLDLATLACARPVSAEDVARHSLPLPGYRLLPGLARACHWTAVSPPAFDEVLDGVRSACRLVVADVTGEFEGEADSGSIDVQERNHMARRCAGAAEAVVALGASGPAGWRRLSSLVDDLLDLGVDPARILPVINRVDHPSSACPGPRHLCGLPAPAIELPTLGAPHAARAEVAPLVASISALLARLPSADGIARPVRVAPGSLGLATR